MPGGARYHKDLSTLEDAQEYLSTIFEDVLLTGCPFEWLLTALEQKPVPTSPESFKKLYRLLQPLRPKVDRCNVRLKIDLVALENISVDAESMTAMFTITATWRDALRELRFSRNGSISYEPLSSNLRDAQRDILRYRLAEGPAFYGPRLMVASTNGAMENRLEDPAKFDRIFVKHSGFEGKADVKLSLLTAGNPHKFPFDTRLVQLHLTSAVIARDVRFEMPSEEDISDITHQVRRHSRLTDWKVLPGGIRVTRLLRGYGQNEELDDQTSLTPEQGQDRSKILVEIRFTRNWGIWFWRVILPMDLITVVGSSAFLLIPGEDNGGLTPDRQIAISTYLVTVLVAQGAFAISVRSMLPNVSYTLLDWHSNFCVLMVGVQTILSVAMPNSEWATNSGVLRWSYIVFIVACLLLAVWHLVLFVLGRSGSHLSQFNKHSSTRKKHKSV